MKRKTAGRKAIKALTLLYILSVTAFCGCDMRKAEQAIKGEARLPPGKLREIATAIKYQAWIGPYGSPSAVPSLPRSDFLCIRDWPDRQFRAEFLPAATNATRLVAGAEAYLQGLTVHMPASLWKDLQPFIRSSPRVSPDDGPLALMHTRTSSALLPRKLKAGAPAVRNGPSETLNNLVYVDMSAPGYATQHPLIGSSAGGRDMAFRHIQSGETIHAVFPGGVSAPEDFNGRFELQGHYQVRQGRRPEGERLVKGIPQGYRYFVVSSWKCEK